MELHGVIIPLQKNAFIETFYKYFTFNKLIRDRAISKYIYLFNSDLSMSKKVESGNNSRKVSLLL